MKTKKNKVVKMLIGVPASGKSTWAAEYVSKHADWVKVGRDDFRFMLKNLPICEPNIEDLITKLQINVISEALDKGLNVIVDNTNLKETYINAIHDAIKTKADMEFLVFDISLEKALERDSKRTKSVGKNILEKMHKQYEIFISGFDSSTRPMMKNVYSNPVFNNKLSNIIICDIDGTLAHMNNKRGPFDWKEVYKDDLDEIIAERLRRHKMLGEKVYIVTGRDESCRKETEEWLALHDIPYEKLLMRKANDFRKDNVIKKEIYDTHIKDQFNVEFVYDDRDQVVKMWRELGIKVFQVEIGRAHV